MSMIDASTSGATRGRRVTNADIDTSGQSLPGLRTLSKSLAASLSAGLSELLGEFIRIEARPDTVPTDFNELVALHEEGRLIEYREGETRSNFYLAFSAIAWRCIIDRIFGGSAHPDSTGPLAEPSPIECEVARVLADGGLETMRSAFSPFAELSVQGGRLVEEFDDSETLDRWLMLQFDVLFGNGVKVSISISVPARYIHAHRMAFKQAEPQPVSTRDSGSPGFRNSIASSQIIVSAVLEKPNVSLADLMALKPGSTIELTERGAARVQVNANDSILFSGSLIQSGTRYAVIVEKK